MNICQGELVLRALCSGMESVWSQCAVMRDGREFIVFYDPSLLTIPDMTIVACSASSWNSGYSPWLVPVWGAELAGETSKQAVICLWQWDSEQLQGFLLLGTGRKKKNESRAINLYNILYINNVCQLKTCLINTGCRGFAMVCNTG